MVAAHPVTARALAWCDELFPEKPNAPAVMQTPVTPTAARKTRSELGQFFTPSPIARFMAGMFPLPTAPVRVLDAGAGEGELLASFVERWRGDAAIAGDAYEIDDRLTAKLSVRLLGLSRLSGGTIQIAGNDFLAAAADMIVHDRGHRYDRAILNPPYRKIATGSRERCLIAAGGLETVNLYSGFVGLALKLMQKGGHLVAIIPRSFCNGPYYRSFRHLILRSAALHKIHLFGSRSDAFSGDAVLQENVIIHVEKGGIQGNVAVSTSTGGDFADISISEHPFCKIVADNDREQVIAIPTGSRSPDATQVSFDQLLKDIGVDVSTGPVVDFRMREHLRAMPRGGDVPLIYPTHLRNSEVLWPIVGSKKPNAIARNAETERWLFPAGWYVAVKRFSSKEERRRVVAAVIDPATLPGETIGLENHINVLHERRRPLPEMIARGLTVYLNSTVFDQAFREFSGHTQVNASDLKRMRFPTRPHIEAMGRLSLEERLTTQAAIDDCMASVVSR